MRWTVTQTMAMLLVLVYLMYLLWLYLVCAGFVNINSTCCIPPCTPEHEPPCQNRKQYWFWDLSYTTERAAKLAASAFYDGPARFTAPVNFKRLIKMK